MCGKSCEYSVCVVCVLYIRTCTCSFFAVYSLKLCIGNDYCLCVCRERLGMVATIKSDIRNIILVSFVGVKERTDGDKVHGEGERKGRWGVF